MARPERKNVDYFPHYMNHGAKMKYLENKYGNDGYAVWYKIIERLAHSENHYVDLNDEIQITFLSDFCKVSEIVLLEIIEFLVKANWLHKKLWEKRVLFSGEFLASIQDAYERRKNECIKQQDIELMYLINSQEDDVKAPENPQSIVKKTRVKKTKEDDVIPPPPIFSDVLAYFKENGYSEQAAKKAFDYYQTSVTDTKPHWSDGKGNPIKNWKMKMQSVWFKEEHKEVKKTEQPRFTYTNPIL